RSIGGNDQSSSTDFTTPDLSSGANIQSEAIARPSPANTPSRTPSAALTRTRPSTITETLASPRRNVHAVPPRLGRTRQLGALPDRQGFAEHPSAGNRRVSQSRAFGFARFCVP